MTVYINISLKSFSSSNQSQAKQQSIVESENMRSIISSDILGNLVNTSREVRSNYIKMVKINSFYYKINQTANLN